MTNNRFIRLMLGRAIALGALCAAAIAAPDAAAATRGEKSVGLRAGYTTSNRSAVAGLYFHYSFADWLRLAPDAGYSFRNNGTDALSLNLNVHAPCPLGGGRWSVFPLAGLNYTSWNIHRRSDLTLNGDSKTRTDRLGINIGGGVDYYVRPSLRLGFEGKYRWTRDYNSGVFTLGIGYVF